MKIPEITAQSEILERINQIYDSINWNKLEQYGYHKKDDYCFIYSYPPVRTLSEIPRDHIFLPSEWEPVRDSLNMYIHIPYCTGICSYCYFAKVIDNKHAPVTKDEYIDLLIWEIGDKLARYNPDAEISTIHFGGGTPSTLEPHQIRKIMSFLKSLNLSDQVEITFECSPETIQDIEKLHVLKESGVNRINIGVESLENHVLKMMGRRHTVEMTENAIANAKQAGFDNINIDLIYALPGESLQSWIDTLRRCLEWELESVSVYRLRKHPKKKISKYEAALYPSYEDSLKMQIAHAEILQSAGYKRVQSHKYASAQEKIQQQTEKKRSVKHTQLLSAGCGAYGFLNGTFYWNTKSLVEYGNLAREKKHPTWIGKVLTKDDLMRKSCVLGVHTSKGINRAHFIEKFGEDPTERFRDVMDEAVSLGLLTISEAAIQPTELGYFFGDEISTKFYSDEVKDQLSRLGMRYGMFFEQDRYA